MIASLLGLLLAGSPQATQPPAAPVAPVYVVSITNEGPEDDFALRFVLSGPPASYSATKEGDDIVVRIAAQSLPGLRIPALREPIRSLTLGSEPEFTLRVRIADGRAHEMARDSSSLQLIVRKPPEARKPAPPAGVPIPGADPLPKATPAAANRSTDPAAQDTADLYRRLFPPTNEETGTPASESQEQKNWYSDFTWLGLQARPWVSVSFVDGKTTQVGSNEVTSDSYWVIQPNLGFGFSPQFGGPRGGQWKINYTPRFRRKVDVNLPGLTSHFFDIGLDQPVASFGSIYGNYHFSKGVLETEEIDPGREYGIGLNRVTDTTLERFRRNTFGVGVRFDFVSDTQIDVNVNKTDVRYGHVEQDEPFRFGPRAFFDYETRTLNASLRRGVGESRSLGFLFGLYDTPTQKERKQVEGRGYSYNASVEGEIAALTTGRLVLGYRTQKSPNAGAGGQDYKAISYNAQLVRQISDDFTLGLGADRKLFLSAYLDNAFYVADTLRGDLNTRVPLGIYLRGNVSTQSNSYKASPQVNAASGTPILRKDRIRTWSIGLARSMTRWAFLRFDYASERRNSNLDRFDLKTRALTFQLGLGFFGTPGGSQIQPPW